MIGLRRKRGDEATPPGRVTGWEITAKLAGGRNYSLRTSVYSEDDLDEMLRVCDALVDGLNRAGFPAAAVVTRESAVPR